MSCKTCEGIEKREGQVIYSDPYAHVMLPQKPAAKGHIRVYSKKHAQSLDDLNHEEADHIFQVASMAATVLFETLGAQGTNIILDEGIAFEKHIFIDVVARKEGDGLNMRWTPNELPEENMKSVQNRISSEADLIGREEPKRGEPVVEKEPEKMKVSDDNPMIKQLKKLP